MAFVENVLQRQGILSLLIEVDHISDEQISLTCIYLNKLLIKNNKKFAV